MLGAEKAAQSGLRLPGQPEAFGAQFRGIEPLPMFPQSVDANVLGSANAQRPTSEVKWSGLRTISELRKEKQIPITINKDSLYRPVGERKKREFKKLVIPKKLAETLPYASKPKETVTKKKGNYVERRAVLMNPEERFQRTAVHLVSGIGQDKIEKRRHAQTERVMKKRKLVERETDIFDEIRKRERKSRYIQKAVGESTAKTGKGMKSK